MNYIPIVLTVWALTEFMPTLAHGQQQASPTKYQPTQTFPDTAVAKWDAMTNPKILGLMRSQKTYGSLTVNCIVDPDKDVYSLTELENAKPNSQRSFDTHLPRPGKMVRSDVELADVEFFRLDGTPIPEQDAVNRLKTPTHVFVNQVPDLYFRAMLRDDIIVVLPRKGKSLPILTTKLDF